MKKIITLLFVIAIGTYVQAQNLDTVVLVSKAKRFTPSEHIFLMFELADTVDAAGKNLTISRSYYFDKANRTIGSVRELENPRKPEKGLQVIYSFHANKLAVVTVIPPRSVCRKCESRYFFANDSLVSKQENGHANINSADFIKQAHYFQSKVPDDLPWGYFDDEVIVNGKKKKIKKEY